MEEEASEKLAQLQHENTKLHNDLIHLQNYMGSLEDHYYIVNRSLSEKEDQIKSLKQEMTVMSQNIKEKELLIESLEEVKDSITEEKKKFILENESLKVRLHEEKLKSKEIESLKIKEEELKNACARAQEQNFTLLSELSIKVKEHSSSVCEVNQLQLQIKELEEKIKTMADALFFREQVKSTGSSDNVEKFPGKELEQCSPSPKSETNLLETNGSRLTSSFKKEKFVSLREEMLEAEVQDKRSKIRNLEKLLNEKEEEEAKRDKLIMELKENLERAKHLNYDWKSDSRPDGQSGECKPLTEVPTFAVVVKDGVQTTQPGAIRIVETISIASQTDPIKILSPVLQSDEYEKFTAGQYHSPSDSDDEGHPLSLGKENDKGTGLQLFSEHKNFDLDMDIYRSCRKLSVLPEEENDEFFNRINSFKNCISSKDNVKVKIHSADDVTKIKRIDVGKPLLKGASSCTCIITSNYQTGESTVEFSVFSPRKTNFAVRFDNDKSSTDDNVKPVDEQLNNNELQLPILSTRDALSQPHSFDSYLNPEQSQSSILARQISDPTQNTVFGPPITRRGSYIRKPRSTCRPLRLPCDKDDAKKEERVCKVRFDLSGIAPKSVDNTSNNHSPNSIPQVRSTNNVKMVSRFRVEVVDEVEFRKSIEETSSVATRKRPSLKHSVMYKKAVFRDLTNVEPENETTVNEESKGKTQSIESPDSLTYDTATENSPVESFEVDDIDMSGTNELCPFKKRKQSSDDSQDSSEGDILIKSIKLHTNSQCILMKDLGRESSNSSQSTGDGDIPFIDSDDLPVIKPNPEILKISPITSALPSEETLQSLVSPKSPSGSSDIYFTPGDTTPVSDTNDTSPLGASKSIGLYKSPTVLKNLANFELLTAISESVKKSSQHEILEEEEEEEEMKEDEGKNVSGLSENVEGRNEGDDSLTEKANDSSLKRTASDVSETSETDTLTYGTVRSHLVPSSDCESDTYVTIWSEGSSLERKCSDLSENSSSPYNTPPDTSSASFCTPPDTYSPLLGLLKKYAGTSSERSYKRPENSSEEGKWEDAPNRQFYGFNSPNTSPPPQHSTNSKNESKASISGVGEVWEHREHLSKCNIIFDSPKLEFYETNDSVENLEAFLQTEEGLTEQRPRRESKQEKSYNLESLTDSRLPDMEEDFREALSKRNSLDSPCDYKFLERRGTKRHPPLSRQNSTEDYNFLEPHDSCLNLSEEMSSPSTTPDTSNKTVIFKNVPLTVSNTIDLEDEDFPISEADIQLNFNGSQAEMGEMPLKVDTDFGETTEDVQCCRSEPCTPSISSSMDFPEFSVLRKQRLSVTGCCPASLEESLTFSKSEANLPAPPEIIVSNLSSESDISNSNSNIPGCSGIDFPSNVSERSEVHFSDVTSLSENSDICGSGSEHSDNLASDVLITDSDKSNAISPEVSEDSSPSPTDKPSAAEKLQDEASAVIPPSTLSETFSEVFTNVMADRDVCPLSRPSSFQVSLSVEGNTGTKEMLKRSETDISGIEELGESSSEKDSNNSRDVNLNSKNYVDCNLKRAYCESGDDRNVTFDSSFPEETMSSMEVNSETGEEKKGARRKEEFDSNQTTQPDSINVTKCVEALVPVSNSTPKPESSLSPKACTFLLPKTVGADTEENENEKTYVKTKSFPKQNSLLSPEETEKKFQDLSFAFKTDSMTIRERLYLLKRKRDQDEANIENELKGIKTKLESFQSLAANSEYLNLMSDLKKQLEFVWNATIQLSSSAESYGYTQHEERLLEFFSVMVQHLENVQSNESSKMSNKTKGEDKRPQTTSSLDNESDEERIQRRRSLAAVAFEGPSRRRASIATLPRSPMSEVGSNGKGVPWASCNRISCSTSKKLSFSQKTPSRAYISSSPGAEETKRDLITIRRRSDSRTSESMKDIDECLERRILTATDTDALAQVDADDSIDESSFHLRQMYESVEDLRQCSLSTESVGVVYCLRRIVKWNKLVIKATRFRWPDQVFHYVPFYITWYVVFVLALVFAGGLFTGINGCYTYSRLECSLVCFAVLNFLLVVRRLYRILLLLFFVSLLVLNLLWLWLTKVVFPVMSEEEMDAFLKTFGFVVEVRYPNGPPPI